MITLTYGHKKPETGDKGSTFFPALEDNIDIDDSHTHNGVNSSKIDSSNLTATELSVTAAGWVASGIWYRKQVTYPGTHERYGSIVEFYFDGGANDGQPLYPKVEYVGDTSFWLYYPDNTQAFKVVFK
jgi:hypothetical protein